MRKSMKTSITLATTGALVLGGAAFGITSAQASTPSVHTVSSSSSKIPGPVASVPEVLGGNTAVKLDSCFTDALTALKLTPGVSGDAKLADGSVSFPITSGSVTYWSPDGNYRPYVQGLLNHDDSGLTLTAGETTVTLENFVVNPGSSKLYGDVLVNGKVAVNNAYLFSLHGGTLKPLQLEGDNAILTGTTVHVSGDAAKLLNSTFKTDAVKSGLLVGVATITAQIK
ncbi:hypothetical protein JOE58_002007 [Curtobacterium luteum]|uniref:Uncharacterized protein n=1 Tax=Curtobacterium luteum TaxID=33881 RepID=A0A8H9GCX3_9MICO|nr:hypothetical protein [Curtobacterium luteum]MBM7802756.1 hypothetical protein [Curtobacterium luteum]NUU51226.1 hypothetical protein [Curtobacterium luteum]GGL12013.1 hypothetical protein GCM10009769_32500 [Curtobacterium luteum]